MTLVTISFLLSAAVVLPSVHAANLVIKKSGRCSDDMYSITDPHECVKAAGILNRYSNFDPDDTSTFWSDFFVTHDFCWLDSAAEGYGGTTYFTGTILYATVNCSASKMCACKDADDALQGCGDGGSWTAATDDGGLGPSNGDACDDYIFPKKKNEWCTRPYFEECNSDHSELGQYCTKEICNTHTGDQESCCEEDKMIWGGIFAGVAVLLIAVIILCCKCCCKSSKKGPEGKVEEELSL